MKETFIIDACALIAYFKKETGFETLIQIFDQASDGKISILMHKINLLEVYYGFYRDDGKDNAESVLEDSLTLPITYIDDLGNTFFKEAGRLKAIYDISFADSFALALSSTRGEALITADHHEFDIIEQKETIKFNWFR